jgi:hypothetical protein
VHGSATITSSVDLIAGATDQQIADRNSIASFSSSNTTDSSGGAMVAVDSNSHRR